MVQVQKHRAPKLKNVQRVYEEGTPPVLPEAIPLHKEDQAVEEKQSYAMITGLLQILVYMQSPVMRRPRADLFFHH